MNKRYLSFGVVALLLVTSTSVEAQLLNRLKNKAKDRVKEKVENKIDRELEKAAYKMVDKSWASIFGEEHEETKTGSSQALPFTLNSNVKTEKHYTFRSESIMELISTGEDGEEQEPVYMKMYSGKEEYTGTIFMEKGKDDEKTFLVYDYINDAMLMLMENEEGKFSFAYDWAGSGDAGYETEEGDIDQTMVGYESIGTKEILGYECEGYRSESDEQVTEFWVSKDKDLTFGSALSANANTRYMRGVYMAGQYGGVILEMVSEKKDSDEKFTMRMTQIDKKVNLKFEMVDYPVIGMGDK